MLYSHAVLNLIDKQDIVVDVGGGFCPFPRANYVVDAIPYSEDTPTNGFLSKFPRKFSPETWIIADICEPLPFKDKEFDFSICTHVLEDIRDPVALVKELQRISTRGYIEVPSRFYEQLMGLEISNLTGATHHRWVTDLLKNKNSENELIFIYKNPRIHFDKNLHIFKPFFQRSSYPFVGVNYEVIGIVWNGAFNVKEDIESFIFEKMDFFVETKKLAYGLGINLFDKNQKSVVNYSKKEIPPGVHSISELSGESDEKIVLYDSNRNLTKEIIAYEKELHKKLSY